MSKNLYRTIVALGAFGLSSMAAAETYSEVWTCTLEDGKTVEDVQAVNSKWLAWVRENVSGDISSSVVQAVVGKIEGFLFVDSYPDLATWSNTKTRPE